MFARDGGLCWICGKPAGRAANGNDPRWRVTLDHVVPVSKGGRFTFGNLRVAHKLCNMRRGNSDAPTVPIEPTDDLIAAQKRDEL